MPKYHWAHLNSQQVGAYGEYFVKMEFTMHGFQVFTPEVDDRGVDFIARFGTGNWNEVQVKTVRDPKYIFFKEDKFKLSQTFFVAVVILTEGKEPDIFLIPRSQWEAPTELFVYRSYEGLVSSPEWGINLSKKNLPLLEQFRFANFVQTICQTSSELKSN